MAEGGWHARAGAACRAAWIGGNGLPLEMHVTGKAMDMATHATATHPRFIHPSIPLDPPRRAATHDLQSVRACTGAGTMRA